MKYFLIIYLIVISISTVAGSYNEEALDLYFPINDGFRWEYLVEENGKVFKQEVTCKIFANNDQSSYDFILEANSIRQTKYYYKISNDTIYSIKMDVKWNILPFKIVVSNYPAIPVFFQNGRSKNITKWNWEGRLSSLIFNKHIKINSVIKGLEKINTPIGVLECLKLVTTYEYENKTEQYIAWYAKNIGLAKFESPKHNKKIIAFSQS